MKTKKYLFCLISIVVLFVSVVQSAFAHSASQSGIIAKEYSYNYGGFYVGGETVGWSIDENYHAGTNTVSYKFDSTVNYGYKQIFYNGANLWYGYALFYESNSNPTGTITTYSDTDTTTIAAFYDYIGHTDSNGHLTSWKIKMNTAKTVTDVDISHELGHVLGLNDLYSPTNAGKLMYGYSSGTATGPTASDIKGMQVITGSHTTHTWGYKYYTTNTYGQHVHAKYCTVCNGFHAASSSQPNVVDTGLCVYKNGICKICGNPENSTPW